MNVGEIVIGTKLDTKDFTAQIKDLESEVSKFEKILSDTMAMDPYEDQKQDIKEMSLYLEKAKNKLSAMYKQQEKINKETKNTVINMKNVEKGTNNVVKSISNWALAAVGIRSAYMLIRRTISDVSKYNKQVSTDLEYMRYAIAMALTPVVEYLVQLMAKLMYYVGYLAKAWFGVNIYAKASAKNFKNANSEANKMKKTLGLASFDEANTVSNNNNSGGGVSGIKTPSFDLGQNIKVPEWLKWIKDNGKLIASILTGVAVALGAIKLGVTALFGLAIFGVISQVVLSLTNFVEAMKNAVTWIKDPSWENFYNLLISMQKAGGFVGYAISMAFQAMFKDGKTFEKFMDNLFSKITKFITNIPIFGNAFKVLINGIISMINTLTSGINKIKLPKAIASIVGFSGFNFPKIPKLARGGLVNNPGKGVMMGNYIAGESGSELIAPLSDPVALETIGQAIGRYITINATIENSMNGRVISRELQRIQNDNNFASNR